MSPHGVAERSSAPCPAGIFEGTGAGAELVTAAVLSGAAGAGCTGVLRIISQPPTPRTIARAAAIAPIIAPLLFFAGAACICRSRTVASAGAVVQFAFD